MKGQARSAPPATVPWWLSLTPVTALLTGGLGGWAIATPGSYEQLNRLIVGVFGAVVGLVVGAVLVPLLRAGLRAGVPARRVLVFLLAPLGVSLLLAALVVLRSGTKVLPKVSW